MKRFFGVLILFLLLGFSVFGEKFYAYAATNLASGKLPSSSVQFTNISRLTDGDKTTSLYSDSYPYSGLQWVQIDLGASYNLTNITLWHYFGDTRQYHDVIVQLSNSASFSSGVSTVFNNDTDNSAGKGAGTDSEYTETSSGRSISFTAVNARYARFYSNGNTINNNNHYVEIEIYDSQTSNLLKGIQPSSSVTFSNASRITDGSKADTNMYSDSYPASGLQWIQFDLGSSRYIGSIKLWHYYGDSRIYHDVIVQVSNSASFSSGVTTLFNNDTNNSARKGTGKDAEYTESSAGKTITTSGVTARYVRFYSNGSTANKYNHYVEAEVYSTSAPSSVNPLPNAYSPLNIQTYAGSNNSTHPSIQYFPSGWNGHKYWMAVTPLYGTDEEIENPCLYVSEDGINWSEPSGLSNPLTWQPDTGHNCDTEIFYNQKTNELWIYYVESNDVSGSWVKLMKSGNGINWTSPQTVVTDFRAKYSSLSPTVEYIPSLNKYYMWTVNAGNAGWISQSNIIERRESTDGITWSKPSSLTNFKISGNQPWHIFIRYIPSKNQYWALVSAYPNGSNTLNTLLYFAQSADGSTWTSYSKPAMYPGLPGSWDDLEIYRSTFIYDSSTDKLKVWYSALDSTQTEWGIGYTQNTYTDFIKKLSN